MWILAMGNPSIIILGQHPSYHLTHINLLNVIRIFQIIVEMIELFVDAADTVA